LALLRALCAWQLFELLGERQTFAVAFLLLFLFMFFMSFMVAGLVGLVFSVFSVSQ